jgi:hypothetical protein
MKWSTPQYLQILDSKLPEYLSSKKDARALIVESAVVDIKAVAEKLESQLPPDIRKVCKLD